MTVSPSDSFLSLPPLGTLPSAELAKLLLKAGREKFEGSLVIQGSNQNKAALRFINGCATRWLSSSARDIVTRSLTDLLPPEQMGFVRAHAAHQQTDDLTALIRLGLLPDAALRRVHRDCTLHTLQAVAAGDAVLRYQFYAGQDCFAGRDGMNYPIESVVLVTDFLLSTADLAWVKSEIQPFRHDTLVLKGRVTSPDLDLAGVLRQVVAILRRQPTSFDTLRLRRLLPEDTLAACVFSLLGTDCATLQRAAASRAPAAGATSLPPAGTPSMRSPSMQSPSMRSPSMQSPSMQPSMQSPSMQPSMQSPSMQSPSRAIPPVGSPASAAPSAQGPLPRHSSNPIASSAPGPSATTSVNPPHSGVVPAGYGARSMTPTSMRSPSSSRIPATSTSTPPASSPGGPSSANRSSSGRATTQPQSSSPHSVAPKDENAVESSALDAWMKSVADPSCTGRALQIAARAASRFPDNPRILFYFGCLQARNGQPRDAETTMRRVLKLDPDHIEAQYELKVLQRNSASQSQTRPAIMGLFGGKKSNSG